MVPIARLFTLAVTWLLSRLSDDTLRRLVARVFVRTTRSLEAASRDVPAAQQDRLLRILRTNADTLFGKQHGFADIQSVEEYRARVPIHTWDDIAPLVDRMVAGERGVLVAEDVFFYATTSGTTGRRKLIPVTSGFVEECRVATRVLFRTTFLEMPGIVRGKRLSMRSPKVEPLAPGVEAGSITVALSGGLDGSESAFDAVPTAVYRVEDFATRYRLCIRFAAQEHVTLVSAVNPSTLLLFARTLEEHWQDSARALEDGGLGEGLVLDEDQRRQLSARAKKDPEAARRIRDSAEAHGGRPRLRDLWPDLAGLVCWKGGSAPWYLSRLGASYGELPVLDYGYAASEGCFGAPLSADGAASVLLPHGHFFELMPEEHVDEVRAGERPTTLLHEAEPGRRYYVVVTTGAGLYRYDMNDVVEVVGRHHGAPLVVFRQKGGAMASITGEKVGESHVVQAMDGAATRAQIHVAGFVAAPLLPVGSDDVPAYLLAVDPGDEALSDDDLARLAAAFDEALQEENSEYEAKRGSLRLGPVIAARLPAHAIARHRQQRVKAGAPDAHVKIPHVSPDGRLLTELGLDESAPALSSRLARVEAAA